MVDGICNYFQDATSTNQKKMTRNPSAQVLFSRVAKRESTHLSVSYVPTAIPSPLFRITKLNHSTHGREAAGSS